MLQSVQVEISYSRVLAHLKDSGIASEVNTVSEGVWRFSLRIIDDNLRISEWNQIFVIKASKTKLDIIGNISYTNSCVCAYVCAYVCVCVCV